MYIASDISENDLSIKAKKIIQTILKGKIYEVIILADQTDKSLMVRNRVFFFQSQFISNLFNKAYALIILA